VAFLEIGPWSTGVGDNSPRAQGAVRNCALNKKIYYFKPPNGSVVIFIQFSFTEHSFSWISTGVDELEMNRIRNAPLWGLDKMEAKSAA